MTAALAKRIEWITMCISDKDVLDVGCVGEDFCLHKKIKERAHSVLGIDINREGIERMRSEGHDVMYADAEQFNANPISFDVVGFGACLEHMDNLGLALDCAWKNLRDGGRLVITTPNARHLGVAFKEMVGKGHRFIFTPRSISNLLKAHGFKIVEIQFFRDEGKLNPVGWLYEKVFLRFLPQLASKFGVVAEKVN